MARRSAVALSSAQLALLVEIGKTGSLARTALALDVSPPAISQQLTRLEHELGVTLVERGPRGAKLTPIGQQLAGFGARISEQLQAAEQVAAEFRGQGSSRLRIGSLDSVSRRLLPEVLAAMGYRFPDLQVSLTTQPTQATVAMVAAGELDIGFCDYYGPPQADGAVFGRLVEEPLLVVLPDDHRLAGNDDPVDLCELAREKWVCLPAPEPGRKQLDEAALEAGFVPRVVYETHSYDVMQALVATGVAVALVAGIGLTAARGTVALPLRQHLRREVSWVRSTRHDRLELTNHFLHAVSQVLDDYVNDTSTTAADGWRRSECPPPAGL